MTKRNKFDIIYLEDDFAMKTKRVFLIVLDSFGIGALPDAASYGDYGANTLASVMRSDKLSLPNMKALGLFNICGVGGGVDSPLGAYCRLAELSGGKDTIIGHWEICGVVSERPLPTYPHGFPRELILEFEALSGRGVLCNLPYSGTQVIADYGKEHLETGKLIVYTSADSVFQVAAHEGLVPVEELYRYCAAARDMLKGEHAVGRVIARPFDGEAGSFVRTVRRKDYALPPPRTTLLDCLAESGLQVVAVGKINDIFAGKGVTRSYKTHGNSHGMEVTDSVADEDFTGLCFVNLVDFDMLYGHRRDVEGYAAALTEFDRWLGGFMARLGDGDVLMITADHGCDPGYGHTDHTREYVPLMVYGKGIKPVDLGERKGFSDIGKTVGALFGINAPIEGLSFADRIIK